MTSKTSSDFVIIGAGIIGLAIAHELISRNPSLSIVVLDKESDAGTHASGRNSGILHAGFYYSPESLKARLTREGNKLLRDFLDQHKVPVISTGKVVVVSHDSQIETLHLLASRAQANGVDVSLISQGELSQLEPRARTCELALWSPTTSVADPRNVIDTMAAAVKSAGVAIHFGQEVMQVTHNEVHTKSDTFVTGHVINAAGLYADKIAQQCNFGHEYVMLPFKGLYWYADVPQGFMTRQVYPVPDVRNPFLGVHVTLTAKGKVKIGPTAIPGFWRENYSGLSNFSGREFAETLKTYPRFLTSKHHNAWDLVKQEFPKYLRHVMISQAQELVPSLPSSAFKTRGQVGIRAQLFNVRKRSLEMDFIIEGDKYSTHMLNSVSPAWTSSMAVAKYVVTDLEQRQVL